MKNLLSLLFLFSFYFGFAQTKDSLGVEEQQRREKNIQAGNPFKKFGYTPKIATLSKGKYLEFHDLDSIVKIGSFSYHVKNKSITGYVQIEEKNSEATLSPEIISRWFSPDPLSEEYTSWSPYNFVMNNPIYLVDPDGRGPFDFITIFSNGSILRQTTDDNTDTFTYVDDGGNRHQIGTYAKNDGGLIQTPEVDYENGGTSVTISTKDGNEDRQYISGTALASMIGASADSGQEISVVSVSNSDGSSPAPSASHTNGQNADIRYAGKNGSREAIDYENSKTNFDKIDQKASAAMNGSLNKFGYKDIRSSALTITADGKTQSYSVSGTKDIKNHYNHEHLQGYRPNVTTRVYQKPISTLKTKPIHF